MYGILKLHFQVLETLWENSILFRSFAVIKCKLPQAVLKLCLLLQSVYAAFIMQQQLSQLDKIIYFAGGNSVKSFVKLWKI